MSAPLPGAPLATAGTWHDHAPAVAVAARESLRIAASDQDAPRFERHAAAACAAIDGRLQLQPLTGRLVYTVGGLPVVTYAANDVPADILEAAVQVTVGLFHRKDAPLGVLTNGMAGPVFVSRDQLAQVSSLVDPYVEAWGMA